MSAASQIALLTNEMGKVRNCWKSLILLCASGIFEHCQYESTFTLVHVSFSVRPIFLKLQNNILILVFHLPHVLLLPAQKL